MPDAGGRFKGISVPELPWLERADECAQDYEEQECSGCWPPCGADCPDHEAGE